MSLSSDNRNKVLGIAVAAIIGLLVLNAYLLYNKSKLTQANDQLSSQLDETSKLKIELETQYQQSLSQLEEMRDGNAEMSTLIESQKTELKTSRDKIAGLLKNKGDLSRVKEQLTQMMAQRDQYVAQLESLKTENAKLLADNTSLNADKTKLTSDLNTEKSTTAELSTAKAALVSDKQNLTVQNEKLGAKVTRASVIAVSEVKIDGFKVDSKSKEHKKRMAKNIDRLRVTFSAASNNITDGGTESFFIRMINPLGETLAREDMGSGTLTTSDTKDKVRYTTIKEIQYANSATPVTLNWDQTDPLAKGLYQVEIYNKGYLCGKGSFKLK